MLFELKKDPSVKSTVFKMLVAKSFGEVALVRALLQESMIEYRDLDEITTEDELRRCTNDEPVEKCVRWHTNSGDTSINSCSQLTVRVGTSES